MWVLCAYVCGQVHAVWHRWSVGASGGAQGHRTVRGTLTVKGQGGASCGLGLDDVAVRDLPASGILETMAARRLRTLLASPGIMQMPCCFDALSAKLVQKAGYPITFASGFSISAAHGLPDTGLMSFGEMEATMQQITSGLSIPCIGDGDTGYGNAVNVKRTVRGYSRAGLAGIMIEDQVAPKRCGHTKEKAVVDRGAAVMRVRAAVDAAREAAAEGADPIVIVARTDARATHGLDEAISRAKLFREIGANWRFVEARPLIASDRR